MDLVFSPVFSLAFPYAGLISCYSLGSSLAIRTEIRERIIRQHTDVIENYAPQEFIGQPHIALKSST